jgi:DNA helicase-2/ATP-dependent DNA helicase PcrA
MNDGALPAPDPAVEAILAGLNPEQREAVTHGDGPLLIVAGAGTGKTQVITRRIAWLIATKRARPEEILALTFTDKAAAEMESRVDVLVPYGYTGSTISTFHAFGDRLVRDYGIELGLTRDLRVCTRAEVLVFLREHVFELGLARYAPLGEPERFLGDLVTLFDRARDEDVSPARYLEFAARLAAEAGDDPDIRVLHLPPGADLEINALVRGSAIVVQNSVKEGFGLTVSEALWKGKPVISRPVGGITQQVINEVTGLLVHSTEGLAYSIRFLLANPDRSRELGRNARQFVRNHFLITRHLRRYLLVMLSLRNRGKREIFL